MCLGAGLLAGAGGGAAAGTAAATGFGAAASAGSALGFSSAAGLAGLGATTAAFAPVAAAAPAISFGAAASAGSALGFGSLGASLLASAPAISFVAPTVTGATGLFGLGAATKPFLLGQALSLGTNIFSTLQQRQAIFDSVRDIYDTSLQLISNAEQAKIDQQNSINDLKKAKDASDKQKIFTQRIRSEKAKGALIASERSGITISLLAQDIENQTANLVESINQTMETRVREAIRDKNASDTKRDSIRNQAITNINKATNAAANAPTLFGAITKTLSSGLTSYAGLRAMA
tara:strand:+ start:277 stop:1149 length:873 start_codon:yes stop_codon:yes gene_type:complete